MRVFEVNGQTYAIKGWLRPKLYIIWAGSLTLAVEVPFVPPPTSEESK